MNFLIIGVAAATLGIDYGWQKLPEGGMEYIIQLDPQTLDAMRRGEPIQSDIPPAAGEIRSYRIVIGKGPLPREIPAPTKIPLSPPKTPATGTEKQQHPIAASTPAPTPLAPEPNARRLSNAPPLLSPQRVIETETPPTASGATLKPPRGEPVVSGAILKPPRGDLAVFEESKNKGDVAVPSGTRSDAAAEKDRPWLPLTFTLLALFASLGANAFLGWVAWGFRQRYCHEHALRYQSPIPA